MAKVVGNVGFAMNTVNGDSGDGGCILWDSACTGKDGFCGLIDCGCKPAKGTIEQG